ncbi:DEAD/DEAH box helicase [Atopobiaceae bacterium SGI.236]
MSDNQSTTTPDAVDGSDERGFSELGLSEKVLQAVADLGYESPTPVQRQAIPEVLAGRDLLAAAQTGTGKTAAFLLPAMSTLGHHGRGKGKYVRRGPGMLVVTPTRELAQQIEDVCRTIEARTGHDSVTVVGGVGYEPQKRALERGCDVLVATPGRLVDLIEQGCCDLSGVRTLVLDEADRMLDMGFLPSMRKIVGQTPSDRQTLLFSATLDEKAIGNIRDLVEDPAVVEIAHKGTVAETIDQFALPVSLEAKNGLLAKVLRREGPEHVIVFCRTKHRADSCCRRLRRAKISCAPIHGNRNQNQRERALAAFRRGECDVLVATDVLARGIDVSDVRYVINFDVPADPEDYIHRIGRTGRAGETGWALTFVTVDDVDDLMAIERLMGKVVPTFERTDDLDLGEEPPALDPDRDACAPTHGKSKRGGKSRQRKRGGGRSRGPRREGDGPDVEAAAEVASGVDASGALLTPAEVKALKSAEKGERRGKGKGKGGDSRRDERTGREPRNDRQAKGGKDGRGGRSRRDGGRKQGGNRGGRQNAQAKGGAGKQRRRVGDRLGARGSRR